MIPESWGWLLILLVRLWLSASSLNETSFHFLAGLFVLSSGTLSHICSLAYSRYRFRNIWVNCSLQVRFCSLFAESYANFPMILTFWCINFSFLILPKNKNKSLSCSGFWPSVKVFLYQIPVVGWIVRFFLWLVIPLFTYLVFMAGTSFCASICFFLSFHQL